MALAATVRGAAARAWPPAPVPVEYRVGLGFLALWAVGVAVGLPVSVPSRGDIRGLELHFFWPLAVAAALQLLITVGLVVVGRRTGSRRRWAGATVMIRQVPLVVLAVFLYFNFKAWTPLVNPVLHDRTYQRLDEALAPVLDLTLSARSAVAEAWPFGGVDDWYGWLFFAMFFLSLGVHGLVDAPHRQRQVVLGLCLNLCIGGLSYWVAPAVGPFLFREGLNASVADVQQIWLQAYTQVRATGELPAGYFTAPLGAMPSLHVAHSVFFLLCAARSVRWLLVPYVPITAWILVEAPASAWHYLVDLPAGVALALLSFVLATRLVRPPAPGEPPAPVAKDPARRDPGRGRHGHRSPERPPRPVTGARERQPA